MDTKRVFVALELPDDLRERIGELRGALTTPDAKVKWVSPDRIHLTLVFAAEAEPEQVEALAGVVRDTEESFGPIRLGIGGLGAFPNRRKPRVIWVGVGENDELAKLQASVADAAERSGLPREKRDFHPHLTVGRVKFVPRESALLKRLKSVSVPTFHYRMETLTLFESTLTPDGPVYRALESVQLCGERPKDL